MANAFSMIYQCALHQNLQPFEPAEFAALVAQMEAHLTEVELPVHVVKDLAEPTRPWWRRYTED